MYYLLFYSVSIPQHLHYKHIDRVVYFFLNVLPTSFAEISFNTIVASSKSIKCYVSTVYCVEYNIAYDH